MERARKGDRRDGAGDLDGAARAYDEAVFVEDARAYTEPPYRYYPVRQSLAAIKLRQGKLDDAEKILRESLARVRDHGWALAGLAETYWRKGNGNAEHAKQRAFANAWFGNSRGPALDLL